jgi:hypothetical protein
MENNTSDTSILKEPPVDIESSLTFSTAVSTYENNTSGETEKNNKRSKLRTTLLLFR